VAFTVKTAEGEGRNETVDATAAPIKFPPEKNQLPQCFLVEAQFEKLVALFEGLRAEMVIPAL